jgi:hypothetical protein
MVREFNKSNIKDFDTKLKVFVSNLRNLSIFIELFYTTLMPKKILDYIVKGSNNFDEFKVACNKFIKEYKLYKENGINIYKSSNNRYINGLIKYSKSNK